MFKSYNKVDPSKLPVSFTIPATSSQPQEGDRLDGITVGDIKRLLLQAYDRYNDAYRGGHEPAAQYWDGYIRGLQHVLEMRHE